MALTYEEARMKYKPNSVRTLFIGESRPAGGTFFFNENSNLYYATKEAFKQVMTTEFNSEIFKKCGCWLYDVCDEPVNNLPRTSRKAMIQEGIPALCAALHEFNPESVFVIKKGDFGSIVYPQIIEIGYINGETSCLLPFPLYQFKRQYINELADMLKKTVFKEK